jgi:hypothetical protein
VSAEKRCLSSVKKDTDCQDFVLEGLQRHGLAGRLDEPPQTVNSHSSQLSVGRETSAAEKIPTVCGGDERPRHERQSVPMI